MPKLGEVGEVVLLRACGVVRDDRERVLQLHHRRCGIVRAHCRCGI